eukprot:scaffold54828_cov66-Phaeocystis_antarctica.AAC.4
MLLSHAPLCSRLGIVGCPLGWSRTSTRQEYRAASSPAPCAATQGADRAPPQHGAGPGEDQWLHLQGDLRPVQPAAQPLATARHQPLRAVSARPSLLSAVGKGGATRDHANAEDASPHRPASLRRRRAWTRGAALPVHRQLHYAKAHYTTPQPGSMLKGVEPMSLVGALRRAARCLPRLLASWAAWALYGHSAPGLNAWQTDWNKYFVRLPGCTRLGIDE